MRDTPKKNTRGAPTRRAVLVGSSAGAGLLTAFPGLARTEDLEPASVLLQSGVQAMGISPRSYGAIGDGQIHPLSDRFATLDQARAVYPFAERLDQSLDWAGIQAALDAAEPVGGMVLIPVGRFIISDTLRLPSGVTLQGESRNGSVIDNQNWRLAVPQLANKDPLAFLYVTIRDLTLNGGSHALRVDVSREVAGIVIEGVTTNLQSEANFEFSSLQTCVIRDCHLMDGRFSLHVRGFPCNSVHLINSRLGQHSDASIRLRGVDGFVMFGGSIEAGITPGKATIDIETGGAYAQAIEFSNVYFENTHSVLLRSSGARVVGFAGCKFTGTGVGPGGGPGPYEFDCGDDLIFFTDNFFHVPTVGPANSLMTGNNHNLRGGGTVWRRCDASRAILTSRTFTQAEASRGLFGISLEEGAGRVWGHVELFVDSGEGEPLQRIHTPFDVALSTEGGRPGLAQMTAPGLLDIRLREAGAHVMLSAAPMVNISARKLWFTLDLSQEGSRAMNVNVF